MPLYFRPRLYQRIGKKLRFAAAILILLLALCVVGSWLVINYFTDLHQNTPTQEDDASSAPEGPVFTVEDTGNLLVIFHKADLTRFVLIQADPANGLLHTVPVPPTLVTGEKTTLADTLKKSGPAKAVSALGTALELPLNHYIQFTVGNFQKFLDYLENGVPYTLSEKIKYTDENGATQQLKPGKHTLSALQTASLLRYTGWKDKQKQLTVEADLLTGLLNYYLLPSRYFSSDFAALSNVCRTSLRIDDFTAWRVTLEHLATDNSHAVANNADGITARVDLIGTTDKKGLFQPDIAACKQSTPLYK